MRIAVRTLRLKRDVVRLSVAICDPLAEYVIHPGDDWTQGAEVLGKIFSPASDTLVQLLDLLDVRAAEAVDRLLGIPHDEQLAGRGAHFAPVVRTIGRVHGVGHVFREEHGDLRLNWVSVLNLVDEDVRVALSEVVAYFEVVTEEIARPDEQIVKIRYTVGLPFRGVFEHEFLE